MIKSLKIKSVATYDDTGIELNDLSKINFIYGSNGSGKTTLTKYIYEPSHPSYKDCSTIWINDQLVHPLVYNKDFRDRNFGKGSIDGVFTLGEATKEDLEKIDTLKAKRKTVQDNGTTKKATLGTMVSQQQQREEDFKEEIWSGIYKKYERDFKEAFRGFLSKETFKSKLLEEYTNNKGKNLPLASLQGHAKTIFGSRPTLMTKLSEISSEEISVLENDTRWAKKIIGKSDVDIAALIQNLNMNDWVNQGREFLQENDTCPFCQQETISDNFRQQLDRYFDKTFTEDVEQLNKCAATYHIQTENLINLLTEIETAEKTTPTKLQLDLFEAYLKTLSNQFQRNREIAIGKLKEPSRSVKLTETEEQITKLNELINSANTNIEKHNRIVNNFDKAREELIRNIWRFVLDESDVLIKNFITQRDNLQKGIDKMTIWVNRLRDEYIAIGKDIVEQGKKVTSVQPSVDQINLTLQSYGFHNFLIVPSSEEPNKYQIQRQDGEMAESTLSEGEVTFITFLYFLQLAKGSISETNISDDRILIVDDPISSLDSNILFVISALVKEIIKDIKEGRGSIKQLVLLTHNVYFHKEVSFINGRVKECNQTKYWILRRQNQRTSLQYFGMENPIQNSYELLWKELKNRAHCSGLTIQNTMRRIIENYFKILGKYENDDIINKFESAEERDICRSLLYWINEGSHTIPDDLYIERQDDVVERYFEVFKKVFAHTKHLEHYHMMMGEA